MGNLVVSPKRAVIKQVVISFLMVITIGRLLTIESNKVYLGVGVAMFLVALFTAIKNIMYMQWRSNRGWTTTVQVPDEFINN